MQKTYFKIGFKSVKFIRNSGGKCCSRFKKGASNKAEGGKCSRRLKKAAFTLAEVLIVLGIIGVVAAMTLPTIMQKAQEQSLVSGLLKFNTELQQAISLWKNDIDCHDSAGRCLAAQNLSDSDITNFDQIAKFMKIVKRTDKDGTDWLADDTLNYYGNNSSS